jgi:hypothetical protein
LCARKIGSEEGGLIRSVHSSPVVHGRQKSLCRGPAGRFRHAHLHGSGTPEKCPSHSAMTVMSTPAPLHGSGGAVPQPVRVNHAQPGPPGGGGDCLGDPARGQALVGCLDADEHAAVQRGGRPPVRQIAGDRLAHLRRQGKPVAAVRLAQDDDLAVPPADVARFAPTTIAATWTGTGRAAGRPGITEGRRSA